MKKIIGLYDGADESIESDIGKIAISLTDFNALNYGVIYLDSLGNLRTGLLISHLHGETVLVGNTELIVA